MTPSISAVARIASLASDLVVNSVSLRPAVSPFTAALSTHSTTVHHIPFGADPGAALLQQHAHNTSNGAKFGLVSYATVSHPRVLHHLIPHLAELSSTTTVLHVAIPTSDDLSDVLVLRASLPFCIYSRTAQQAHDHALLASRLARTEGKAVLHIFYVDADSEDISEVTDEQVDAYLSAPPPSANGHVNGHANGHGNGHTNGHSNGHTNGHANGDAKSKDDSAQLLRAFNAASATAVSVLRRPLRAIHTHGAEEPHTVLVTLAALPASLELDGVAFVDVNLLKPLPPANVAHAIPTSAQRILVLEHLRRWSVKWTPLFLDVVSALQGEDSEREPRPSVQSVLVGDARGITPSDIEQLLEQPAEGTGRLTLGSPVSASAQADATATTLHVPKHEVSYTKLLDTLFGARLDIANDPARVGALGAVATSPEFTLGRLRGELEALKKLDDDVKQAMREPDLPGDLHQLLGAWLQAAKGKPAPATDDAAARLADALEEHAPILKSAAARRVYVNRALLKSDARAKSHWIIGSDAWAYDLGASGLHHAIASGLNVNVLLLDTTPYSSRTAASRRKQDVGLYAMNHGDVYVASIALYSSYSQVLQALVEADRYPGPSIVLAYLPYSTEESPALEILKETKRAVDAGYWPLYRWDPSKEGDAAFTLDSDAIKNELRTFLDRQNHISQLVAAQPQLPAELVGSLGEKLRAARKARAQKAYADLLTAIDAPPLAVLYASDGGKAEKVAKRLAARAKIRGLVVSVAPMDAVSLEDLAKEQYVAFVTSVAGQGEFPQNGRALVKALSAAAARGEKLLSDVKVGVFGMGDSHYWPRPEDAHYYNKAGKDLDARLQALGAEHFVPLGLGDDQDADGPETGYKAWEPLVWKALGVDAVEVQEAEPEPITNEHIKVASQYLRGTITEGLEDRSTGSLAPSDTQLTKFHGIYQQDDRDIRDERVAQGVEPAYSFMIRVRMPGGVCRPDQWLQMDQIADEHGCGTFKITTRQTFQFHGVIKRHLKSAIQDINRVLLDTLAACGDVNRNVIVSAIPSLSKLHAQAYDFARRVSEHLLPRTTAYHEIWLDKKLVAGEALKDAEPLYGEFYLPRKFKVAVAVPPTNDVDVFANDVGFVAIVDKYGNLAGFNVSAGGGMGVTHGNKKTYPRLGSILGFCTVEQGVAVAEKIMIVQRDNGNREDRKNARLKYTIDRMGLENFKAEVERLLGWQLAPARPFTFDRNVDDYGWHTGEDGKHHFTCFIENGRIQDEHGKEFKTCLREIAKIHKGAFRMTANQHLLITDIATEDLPPIKALLAQYKLDTLSHTGLRLSSSACVAFPTCGLAMAESERYLPILIDKVEKICEESGLRNDSIVMRMTGCPNGCARPYVAEVAFVGKAPGTYSMLLGGGYHGQRLNKIYRETVTEPEILAILRPMIKHYALERQEGEHFGDFVIRTGYIAPTTEGKAWYDRMGGEGQHREGAIVA